MTLTEMMEILQQRGLAAPGNDRPVRPNRMRYTETFSAYRSVYEDSKQWGGPDAKLERRASGVGDNAANKRGESA